MNQEKQSSVGCPPQRFPRSATRACGGERLYVVDSAGNRTAFEYETGLTLNVNPQLIDLGLADGITIEVFDGSTTVVLELDDDSSFDLLNTVVTVPSTTERLASSIAEAINDSALNLSAVLMPSSIHSPISSILSIDSGPSINI